MRLDAAHAMGRDLLARHGLGEWRLSFTRAKRQAGVCRPDRKEIGLSSILTELHPESEVCDTVLHEIAHALVGPRHGHDQVWRAKALELGCTATRCVPESAARAPAPWQGTCPNGHVMERHQQPTRVMSCSRCSNHFSPAYLVEWTFHGRAARMHPNYEAELARIQQSDGAAGQHAEAVFDRLPLGSFVTLDVQGEYAGVSGTIEKRGRSRYHVRTPVGLLTVPFALVRVTAGTVVREE